jgi:hypothetical protein
MSLVACPKGSGLTPARASGPISWHFVGPASPQAPLRSGAELVGYRLERALLRDIGFKPGDAVLLGVKLLGALSDPQREVKAVWGLAKIADDGTLAMEEPLVFHPAPYPGSDLGLTLEAMVVPSTNDQQNFEGRMAGMGGRLRNVRLDNEGAVSLQGSLYVSMFAHGQFTPGAIWSSTFTLLAPGQAGPGGPQLQAGELAFVALPAGSQAPALEVGAGRLRSKATQAEYRETSHLVLTVSSRPR